MHILYSARKTKLGYQATYEIWDKGRMISDHASPTRFITRTVAIDYAGDLANTEASCNIFHPRVCARTSLTGKQVRGVMR
jgi:hypothetical protein